MTSNRLLLIGYRGTGKTTVGRLVAARLGWQFIDPDDHRPPAEPHRPRRPRRGAGAAPRAGAALPRGRGRANRHRLAVAGSRRGRYSQGMGDWMFYVPAVVWCLWVFVLGLMVGSFL